MQLIEYSGLEGIKETKGVVFSNDFDLEKCNAGIAQRTSPIVFGDSGSYVLEDFYRVFHKKYTVDGSIIKVTELDTQMYTGNAVWLQDKLRFYDTMYAIAKILNSSNAASHQYVGNFLLLLLSANFRSTLYRIVPEVAVYLEFLSLEDYAQSKVLVYTRPGTVADGCFNQKVAMKSTAFCNFLYKIYEKYNKVAAQYGCSPIKLVDSKMFGTIMAEGTKDFLLGKDFTRFTFKIVSGSAITDVYNSGDFGGSCMTGGKNPHISIYGNNPDSVRMLLIYHKGLPKGRALLWTTRSGEIVMDRIYPSDGGDHIEAAIAHAQKENWIYKTRQSAGGSHLARTDLDLSVRLKLKEDQTPQILPYLDTFGYGSDPDKDNYVNLYAKSDEGMEDIGERRWQHHTTPGQKIRYGGICQLTNTYASESDIAKYWSVERKMVIDVSMSNLYGRGKAGDKIFYPVDAITPAKSKGVLLSKEKIVSDQKRATGYHHIDTAIVTKGVVNSARKFWWNEDDRSLVHVDANDIIVTIENKPIPQKLVSKLGINEVYLEIDDIKYTFYSSEKPKHSIISRKDIVQLQAYDSLKKEGLL